MGIERAYVERNYGNEEGRVDLTVIGEEENTHIRLPKEFDSLSIKELAELFNPEKVKVVDFLRYITVRYTPTVSAKVYYRPDGKVEVTGFNCLDRNLAEPSIVEEECRKKYGGVYTPEEFKKVFGVDLTDDIEISLSSGAEKEVKRLEKGFKKWLRRMWIKEEDGSLKIYTPPLEEKEAERLSRVYVDLTALLAKELPKEEIDRIVRHLIGEVDAKVKLDVKVLRGKGGAERLFEILSYGFGEEKDDLRGLEKNRGILSFPSDSFKNDEIFSNLYEHAVRRNKIPTLFTDAYYIEKFKTVHLTFYLLSESASEEVINILESTKEEIKKIAESLRESYGEEKLEEALRDKLWFRGISKPIADVFLKDEEIRQELGLPALEEGEDEEEGLEL